MKVMEKSGTIPTAASNNGVVIGPLKKVAVKLDRYGNEITDFKTKTIIKKRDVEPVAPPEVQATAELKAEGSNPLEAIIQKKVQEAVLNSIAKIDIGKIVEDAINNAFGGSK